MTEAPAALPTVRRAPKLVLDALAREHLRHARSESSGRGSETVVGGHEHTLPPTVTLSQR